MRPKGLFSKHLGLICLAELEVLKHFFKNKIIISSLSCPLSSLFTSIFPCFLSLSSCTVSLCHSLPPSPFDIVCRCVLWWCRRTRRRFWTDTRRATRCHRQFCLPKFAHVGSSLGPRGDLTHFQFENNSRATCCRFLQSFAVPDNAVQFQQS